MMTYLLAGGGTAGHVNPMLAVADRLRAEQPEARIVILGTAEGLESRLVPERGYELSVIPKVPFPRRPNQAAVQFVPKMRAAIAAAKQLMQREGVDVVVGFGGYVSTPAYLAARDLHLPIVIHEANARPGLANRLGARFTRFVGVTFSGTKLPHARVVGMPLRAPIEQLAQHDEVRAALRAEAMTQFGLNPELPTLLVTGGSLGARRLNETVRESASALLDAGWQVLHLVGGSPEIDDPQLAGYLQLRYLDRMELALAAADFVVSRAGSSTVSELSAVGLPAVYVPYAVGNGEQRLNARSVVEAGGALLVDDVDFVQSWVWAELVPLLHDRERQRTMAEAARSVGVVDGTAQTVSLIAAALA